ncbi:MAG: LacI family transcriptional regulator, partial [Candidatus Melainabacteria bacterium]
EAIRVAGKTNQVIVVGVDGVPDARRAILAGRMTASITQLPYLIGKRSVELAVKSVHGQCAGATERAPLLVLTKGVLEAKKDPLLQYVR